MNNKIDRLYDGEITAANPGDKQYKLYDGAGLYLHILPSGGKSWRLKYRFKHKEKSLSFGTYPTTSLEEARRSRDAARELLSQGFDPSEIRKQERARDKAEYLEGQRIPAVRISLDGRIEIWKGGNTLHLTRDEARFIANLLTNIVR